ncbi:hypothetical protein BD626DRAFT_488808 [Schizophyllum amplum]|uniref:Integral membrane protein n=1 Tax=Schizophyllum amplum TaxID=97359 RepID=A0A550CKW1_9AGAR|nr:hypothetical protein BD626DRAFT_488808 [Auriculariopsis ampla]
MDGQHSIIDFSDYPWPSLYDPGLELLHLTDRPPTQAGAHYLYHASDVFKYTLYWSFVFYIPAFVLCGFYAFFNLAFLPRPARKGRTHHYTETSDNSYALAPLMGNSVRAPPRAPKQNQGRSRLTFALLVLFAFLALGLFGSVISSLVIGYVLYGLYQAGEYNMSTWIPFLCALMNVVIGFLSMWPSVIDIV